MAFARALELFLATSWTGDGRTFPGMLNIEYKPDSTDICYGLSKSAMVTWVRKFVNTHHGKTGRYPVIYSTADWWNECTGNSAMFSKTCPLVLAHPDRLPETIPGGWPFQTIWQNGNYGYVGIQTSSMEI
jgi:hypothetical protein